MSEYREEGSADETRLEQWPPQEPGHEEWSGESPPPQETIPEQPAPPDEGQRSGCMGRYKWPILLIAALLLLIGAGAVATMTGLFSGSGNESESEDAAQVVELTREAEAEAAATEPAAAETNEGSEASVPPTADADLAMTIAAATSTAQALGAQSAASQQTIEAAALATDIAIQPVMQELAALGVNPTVGQLAFTHPPISMEVTEEDGFDFANRNALTIVHDFVMAADITADSGGTESGCGFAVRSDGNQETPSQYIIGITRDPSGHVLFAEELNGEVEFSDVTDIVALGVDPNFTSQQGGTNRLIVVGRGQQFTIFSNGVRLGAVDGTAGFEEGFVAFVAANRSGGVKCDFNNAYVWKID